jgi:Ca2+-binding EF-hand superfamily protein
MGSMGSCLGGFSPNSLKPGQGDNVIPMCLELGYSKGDINNMHKFFQQMDVYDNGIVSVRAYCATLQVSDSFGKVVFEKMLRKEFGKDLKENITFEQYLLSSWNVLSFFDENSLAIFTFQIFDADSSGWLSPDEVHSMVNIIWSDNTKSNQQVVHALESHIGKNKSINVNGFIILTNSFPILLFPIFNLIRIFRKNTLGEMRWKQLSRRRKVTDTKTGSKNFGNGDSQKTGSRRKVSPREEGGREEVGRKELGTEQGDRGEGEGEEDKREEDEREEVAGEERSKIEGRNSSDKSHH